MTYLNGPKLAIKDHKISGGLRVLTYLNGPKLPSGSNVWR